MKKPSADNEEHAEDQEADIPGKWSSKIVPYVMDLEDVMVDESFHHIEDAPAHE